MSRSVLVAFLAFVMGFCFAAEIPESVQVLNLTAFTKLWGYAKHFCPADEVQEIDWDRFSVYGSAVVRDAADLDSLSRTLTELFSPVVPGLALWTEVKPELPSLHPLPGLKSAFWQYEGYNNTQGPSVYRSIRANRPHRIIKDPSDYSVWASLQPQLPPDSIPCNKLRVFLRIKLTEADTLQTYFYLGFAKGSRVDSLSGADWADRSYELEAGGDTDARLWLAFNSESRLWLEHLRLESWRGEDWQEIFFTDFAQDQAGSLPEGFNVNLAYENAGTGQNMDVLVEEITGKKVLTIRRSISADPYTLGIIDRIFAEEPSPGERLEKELVPGLHFSFPLILSCDLKHTYPVLDPVALDALKQSYAGVDLLDRTDSRVWLAGVIRYWNELNFFYPYFEYNICHWDQELPLALARVLRSKDFAEYKLALWLLISKTRDGHAFIIDTEDNGKKPGFSAAPIDGNWIVNKVLDEDLSIPAGSRVTHMNGVDFARLMRENRPYYSESNPETSDLRLFANYLRSSRDSLATFSFVTPEGEAIERETPFKNYDSWRWMVPEEKFVTYPDGILYVNTNIITAEELRENLPDLLEAKGIILDLRYYPRIPPDLISQLLTQPDSLANCLAKRYIRPKQELERLRESVPTWGLKPAEPRIGAKIVALSGRNSQSYCEQFLAVLKHNKLATIVGQPTAGANGNVILSTLPGNLQVYWTGLLVRNPDQSRFFGIGIIPDVFVNRSLDDIITGRDAELERALLLLRAERD